MVQDYLTYAKVAALIIIVVTGMVELGRGRVEHFTWENTETDPATLHFCEMNFADWIRATYKHEFLFFF